MKTIKLTPKFFRGEREKAYSNWKQAFWRELFQNSIDARSSIIKVSTKTNDRSLTIRFDDNGHGMTPEVVENVFFNLGESHKEDENSVGGFGRARLLTCFSMDGYTFHTHSLFCEGQASEYEIKPTDTYHNGCLFEICVGGAATEDEMLHELRTFLSKCQMDCDVFVNDEKWTNWQYKRRHVKTANFGNIHHNKSAYQTDYIDVRVNGVWMFSVYSAVDGQVVVEIDPTKSRDILLINRDGFGHGYQDELIQWVRHLAVDKKSALREVRRKTRFIRGKGSIVSRAKMTGNLEIVGSKETDVATVMDVTPELTAAFKKLNSAITNTETEYVANSYSDMNSIFIDDQLDGYHRHRSRIDAYDPFNWTTEETIDGRVYNKGGNRKKLLLLWQVACNEAIRCLIESSKLDEVQWLTGWVFCEDAEAMHQNLSHGHALCLNPLDSDGKMKYSLNSRADRKKLAALAKHEVAHIACSWHDESYASVLTDIDVLYDEAKVYREMKEAIRAA